MGRCKSSQQVCAASALFARSTRAAGDMGAGGQLRLVGQRRASTGSLSSGHSRRGAGRSCVYKQIESPPEELTYYELVSRAEVLRSARIDDSDLDRAILTLLPEHSEQLARVEAIALAEGSEDEGE